MAFGFDRDKVFHTTPEGGEVVCHVHREISASGEVAVSWNDYSHRRVFVVAKVLKDSADEFRFVSSSGREFFIRPWTLAEWNTGGKRPVCKSLADVFKAVKDGLPV